MPSRMLKDCDPGLVSAFLAVRSKYENAYPGRQIIITCTQRTPEEQAVLYAQGRTAPGQIVTWTMQSKHTAVPLSRAIDVVILVGGKITWDLREYVPFGKLAQAEGLRWGGDWDGDGDLADEKKVDLPHVELPT